MATTITIFKSDENEFEVTYRTDKFGAEIDIQGKLKENIHSKNMELDAGWLSNEEDEIFLQNELEITEEILNYFYNEYL
jgi:hypothetical protein